MYELLVDFIDGDISESDVRVHMHDCVYKYCTPNSRILHFRYTVHLPIYGTELLREVGLRDEQIPQFIVINSSELEKCILDLIKKDSRFSNIREI